VFMAVLNARRAAPLLVSTPGVGIDMGTAMVSALTHKNTESLKM